MSPSSAVTSLLRCCALSVLCVACQSNAPADAPKTPLTLPTAQDIAAAAIGDAPGDAKAEIEGYLGQHLAEAGQLSIRVEEPERGAYRPDAGAHWRFAWRVLADVEVISTYGFSSTPESYQFYFLGERMVAVLAPEAGAFGGRGTLVATEMNGGGLTAREAGLLQPATPAAPATPR